MEEDEEVVFKNTGLYTHLLNAGFEDFETAENKIYQCNLPVDATKTEYFNSKCTIHCDVEEIDQLTDQINLFLNSNLVFNDDVLFVKNFAIHFQADSSKTAYLRSQYFKLILKTAVISSICVMCNMYCIKLKPSIYVSLHTLPAGMHLAQRLCTIYLKYKRKYIIQKLLKTLKDLSMLVQKSIQFVQQCEIIFCNDWSLQNKEKLPRTNTNEWQTMYHLRKSVFWTIRAIILDLRTMISSVIKNFPLKEQVQSLSYYLAFLDESDLHCTYSEDFISTQHLHKMKYVYFLLQSEFLRQLCLCFIPSLWICDVHILIQDIFKSLNNFNNRTSNLYDNFKSVFEIYYMFERADSKNKQLLNTDTKWTYREAYLKFCSLSFNMQSILRESRRIEEFLENTRIQNSDYEKVVEFLDMRSLEIVKNYNICKIAVDDIRKYIVSLKPKQTNPDVHFPSFNLDENVHKTDILLGITDFRPDWPDEVFVGTSDVKANEVDTADSEEVVKKSYSKLLINELKIALQDKAKEWKERERLALKNKNIDDLSDVEESALSDTEMVHSDESDNEISSLFKHQERDLFLNTNECVFKPIVTSESSFAEQIAVVSASWGLQAEEYFIEDEAE